MYLDEVVCGSQNITVYEYGSEYIIHPLNLSPSLPCGIEGRERQIIAPCWPTFLPLPHQSSTPFHRWLSSNHSFSLLLWSLTRIIYLHETTADRLIRPNSDGSATHELWELWMQKNELFSAVIVTFSNTWSFNFLPTNILVVLYQQAHNEF